VASVIRRVWVHVRCGRAVREAWTASPARSGARGRSTATRGIRVCGAARQLTACAGSCLDDMDPALSPNDAKIAYLQIGGPLVSIGQVEMPATQKLRIATIAPGGLTQVRTIFQTTTTTGLNAPRWSPDGSHLVFWTDHVNLGTGQVDTTAVFTIRADGTHLVQMTPSSMIAGDCDWSPTGNAWCSPLTR